jgi:hypothetical protein
MSYSTAFDGAGNNVIQSTCSEQCGMNFEGKAQPSVQPSARWRAVQVYFYSMTGVRVSKQVSFGPQLEAEGISQACLYPDGLVVLGSNSKQLWAVIGLQEPRAVRLPPIPGLTNISNSSAAVACLTVLEPQFTLSNGLEVGALCCLSNSSASQPGSQPIVHARPHGVCTVNRVRLGESQSGLHQAWAAGLVVRLPVLLGCQSHSCNSWGRDKLLRVASSSTDKCGSFLLCLG